MTFCRGGFLVEENDDEEEDVDAHALVQTLPKHEEEEEKEVVVVEEEDMSAKNKRGFCHTHARLHKAEEVCWERSCAF